MKCSGCGHNIDRETVLTWQWKAGRTVQVAQSHIGCKRKFGMETPQ